MNDNLQTHSCPRCGNDATKLIPVDAGMKLILQQTNASARDLPAEVCAACYNELTASVSQGVKLRLEQQAKEKNRHMLWKSRVSLVKQARVLMQQKMYSEAAVNYEKYLRVLELSYDKKSGELTPDLFGKSSHSKELTVIATCYWDLMLIYDTNPQYRDRMLKAARKLAEFLPYSKIYPDIARKAQVFAGSAKNPDIVKEFLQLAKAGTGRCFIATAAFNDVNHPTVAELRRFRDEVLLHSDRGVRFVMFYYKHSPPIAEYLERHPRIAKQCRTLLNFIVILVRGFKRRQDSRRISCDGK